MTGTRLALGSSLWLLGTLALGGCHSAFRTTAPQGFVELDEAGRYDFRATSADGLVLAVRELDHEPQAELSFWSRAVENAMRNRGGYALLDTKDLAVAGGLPARQLRFGHDEANQPHLYYVTLVVTEHAIYVLEAGGDKPLFEHHAAEIERWVGRFHAKRCAPFPFSFMCSAAQASAAPATAPPPTAEEAPKLPAVEDAPKPPAEESPKPPAPVETPQPQTP